MADASNVGSNCVLPSVNDTMGIVELCVETGTGYYVTCHPEITRRAKGVFALSSFIDSYICVYVCVRACVCGT